MNAGTAHTVTESLDTILEKHRIQPYIRWIRLNLNDRMPSNGAPVIVLFNDGTMTVDVDEDIDWLGAIAFAYIGYSR